MNLFIKCFIIGLTLMFLVLEANDDNGNNKNTKSDVLAQIGELAQEVTNVRRISYLPIQCVDQKRMDISKIYSDNEKCNKFITNKLYEYEVMISKAHPDLTIEEIKTTLVNFSEEFVLTGDTGLLKKNGENSVYISTKKGLIYSYKHNLKKINLDIGITPEDVNRIRQDAFNFDNQKQNKGTDGKVYISTDPVAEDTISVLKSMGYIVISYKSMEEIKTDDDNQKCKNSPSFRSIKRSKKKNEHRFLCIIYPGEEKVKELLKQYAKDLTVKIQSYKKISQDANLDIKIKNSELADLLTYAVRNLLLIHPFSDGSGRTARLLGQILFKKLTGKEIVFPKAFFEEMNYSHEGLKEKLNLVIDKPCSEKKEP